MRRAVAAAAAVLALLGCAAQPAPSPSPRQLEPTATTASPAPSPTLQPANPLSWPAPIDAYTPGGEDTTCTYPRPTSERDVSASTKRAAIRRYQYVGPAGIENLEMDHRIPFSLCGSNTVENIWPQPADGVKQSAFVHNRKDQLEAFAARQVRYKKWTLDYAQDVFRGDWRVAWCRYLHYDGVQC